MYLQQYVPSEEEQKVNKNENFLHLSQNFASINHQLTLSITAIDIVSWLWYPT